MNRLGISCSAEHVRRIVNIDYPSLVATHSYVLDSPLARLFGPMGAAARYRTVRVSSHSVCEVTVLKWPPI